jgi:hypothetical protein
VEEEDSLATDDDILWIQKSSHCNFGTISLSLSLASCARARVCSPEPLELVQRCSMCIYVYLLHTNTHAALERLHA